MGRTRTRPPPRYLTEEVLRPLRPVADVEKADEPVLAAGDLGDLRRFAEVFGREGEATLTQSDLTRKTHLGVFVSVCQVRARSPFVASAVVSWCGRAGGWDDACRRSSRPISRVPSPYWRTGTARAWHREGAVGALELLQHMELRRIDQERRAGRPARPLAERPVAFAVLRARDDRGEDCYLQRSTETGGGSTSSAGSGSRGMGVTSGRRPDARSVRSSASGATAWP
jgi:hypothetical protein